MSCLLNNRVVRLPGQLFGNILGGIWLWDNLSLVLMVSKCRSNFFEIPTSPWDHRDRGNTVKCWLTLVQQGLPVNILSQLSRLEKPLDRIPDWQTGKWGLEAMNRSRVPSQWGPADICEIYVILTIHSEPECLLLNMEGLSQGG